ncbi:MAG: DNA polymerase III subunit beta [Anaerovoracaceae bacterium]|jgi:DNA polymerase-3 subunit beta
MKFSCNQQVLNKALTIVSKAVTPRTTIPLQKGILMETMEDGYLKLTASDTDMTIEKNIQIDMMEHGSLVVSSRLFSDIIRKLPSDQVEIEEDDNKGLIIRCSSSEFTIIGQPPDDFTVLPPIEEKEEILLNKELFKEMIRKTAFSASIDESKGILTGVLIEIAENSLTFVALDGFRMSVVTETTGNMGSKNIIVSARIMTEIYKILSDMEEDENITLIIEDKKAVIKMEDTIIALRLMDGIFLKYKDIIPIDHQSFVKVRREELLHSIERASLMAKEGKNNLIKLDIFRDKIIITSRSEEGNVREELFVEKEGNDLEIGFNAKYMTDVLKVIQDEEIMLKFNTSVTPCLITPVEGNDFNYLVLPVRIGVNQ